MTFSPDSRQALTGSYDGTAILWEAHTGEKLRTLSGHTRAVSPVAFSPDGGQALTGSFDQTAILWDTRTGQNLRTFSGHTNGVMSVAFSPDGRQALTGSLDNTAILWDLRTGQKLRTLAAHTGSVNSVAFSRDNRHVLTGADDGSGRVWDLATGEDIAALISLDGGKDWLVVNRDGFFDGSEGGRQQVAFRVGGGLNVVPVDRFFQDFYRPGLLAEALLGQSPMPQVELGASLPPKVKIISPEENGDVVDATATVDVEFTDAGGGVQGPWLRQNGARVLAAGEKQKVDDTTYRQSFTFALVEGENRLRVEAASADGSWESEPAELRLTLIRNLEKPVLHLLAVGVEKYAEGALNLQFCADDAQALARLFEERGQALYAGVRPHVLIDDQVTRDQLRAEINAIADEAKPQDTLLVFLSGHGVTVGQRYYFIPHDMRREADSFEEDVRKWGVPGDTLADWIGSVPALKRMLILDTCHSGAAVTLAGGRGRDPFAFRGAVERLSREQGIFTLAASAADEQAAEVPALAHGLLTYTLLAGLKAVDGGPLADQHVETANREQVVDVLEWFSFASGQVPRLSKQFTGQDQSVEMHGQGTAFPVLPLEE